jgi:hypothetical protein
VSDRLLSSEDWRRLRRWCTAHGLFDRGYVTVTPRNRFEVSKRIREEAECRPDPLLLDWHNANVFKG